MVDITTIEIKALKPRPHCFLSLVDFSISANYGTGLHLQLLRRLLNELCSRLCCDERPLRCEQREIKNQVLAVSSPRSSALNSASYRNVKFDKRNLNVGCLTLSS